MIKPFFSVVIRVLPEGGAKKGVENAFSPYVYEICFLYNFSSLIINKKTNKYAEATSKHMKKKTRLLLLAQV